jgi:hypothetical protein
MELDEQLEGRLQTLPPEKQHAVLALASGAGPTRAAKVCGVTDRTLRRWMEDPEFLSLSRQLGAFIAADLIRFAIAGLFEIIERERKGGDGKNIRWFLSRTVFAEFERSTRGFGGPVINLNVTQRQAIEATQASIAQLWRQRLEEVGAIPFTPSASREAS